MWSSRRARAGRGRQISGMELKYRASDFKPRLMVRFLTILVHCASWLNLRMESRIEQLPGGGRFEQLNERTNDELPFFWAELADVALE